MSKSQALLTRGNLHSIWQHPVAGQISRLRWIVDDRCRVAALDSHPVALWASEFNPPIRAILDLGFICIEERFEKLIFGLHTSRVKNVTLAGTFYFLAHQRAKWLIIYSDCGTDRALITMVENDLNAYMLLEELVASTPSYITSISSRPAENPTIPGISYTNVNSPTARPKLSRRIKADRCLPGENALLVSSKRDFRMSSYTLDQGRNIVNRNRSFLD